MTVSLAEHPLLTSESHDKSMSVPLADYLGEEGSKLRIVGIKKGMPLRIRENSVRIFLIFDLRTC